jgi:hypothetical protein
MSREAEELDAIKKMLETDGWKIFHREHEQRVKDLRLTSWDSIKTLEQLHYMRGFLAALEGVVGYERLVEAAEANLTNGENPV